MPPENLEQKGADTERLLAEYKQKVQNSDKLSKADKEACLKSLDDPRNKNAEQIGLLLKHLPTAEEAREREQKRFLDKIEKMKKDKLLADPSAKEYEAWVKELSYADLKKFYEKSDLDDDKRKTVLAQFQSLPKGIQSGCERRFYSADLQEREKLMREIIERYKKVKALYDRLPNAVRTENQERFNACNLEFAERFTAQLYTKHEALKKDFLALPKEVWTKHKDAFKAQGLAGRTKILQELQRESGEAKRLDAGFETKIDQRIKDKLFSALSKPAYTAWYKSLSLEQKRVYANNSDLDGEKLKERTAIRDRFYKDIPPEVRAKHEARFSNADIEGRKALLDEIAPGMSDPKKGTSYPDPVVEKILKTSLEDPSLKQQRLVYTFAKSAFTLRRRAEIQEQTKNSKKIAEHAAQKGKKIDQHAVMHLEEMQHHGEARHFWRKFFVRKLEQGQNAQANNLTLLNKNRTEITAEQFNEQIVKHAEAEMVAGIVNRAMERLPRANRSHLVKAAGRLDKRMDLHRVAA